jgi:predicted flap endonuclease-1-like 5' DNA nuclease
MKSQFADERRRRNDEDARDRADFLDGVKASVSELLAEYRAERFQREKARARAAATPAGASSASIAPRDDDGAGNNPTDEETSRTVTSAANDATRDDESRLAAVMEKARQDSAASSDAADASEATGDEDDDIDNLAVIQGIGPKMAFRLREQGVQTFDDLAGSTADEIRELMGGLPSFADVDAWIEQAKERISS